MIAHTNLCPRDSRDVQYLHVSILNLIKTTERQSREQGENQNERKEISMIEIVRKCVQQWVKVQSELRRKGETERTNHRRMEGNDCTTHSSITFVYHPYTLSFTRSFLHFLRRCSSNNKPDFHAVRMRKARKNRVSMSQIRFVSSFCIDRKNSLS